MTDGEKVQARTQEEEQSWVAMTRRKVWPRVAKVHDMINLRKWWRELQRDCVFGLFRPLIFFMFPTIFDYFWSFWTILEHLGTRKKIGQTWPQKIPGPSPEGQTIVVWGQKMIPRLFKKTLKKNHFPMLCHDLICYDIICYDSVCYNIISYDYIWHVTISSDTLFGHVPDMFQKSLEGQTLFFPKSFGGLWAMFWHHPWCLRASQKIKNVGPKSEK